MMTELLIFTQVKAKGDYEMCKLCEKYLDDDTICFIGRYNRAQITICKECALAVHRGYVYSI
jgi:hypothetical protein